MAITTNSPISSQLYTSEITQTNQRLTTGLNINQAADNPAGQAIVAAFSSQINAQDMATQNANSGISLLQTADGASEAINNSLQRMNELAVQARNGILNDSQRSSLNQEFQQNLQAINQIAQSTEFNGQTLLDNSITSLDIALGDSGLQLALPNQTTDGLAITGLDISNTANAATAINGLATAIEQVSSQRAQFGAQQNGLTSAIDNIQSQNINSEAARSQIQDSNFARSVSEQVRLNVLQDSAIAMQAQSNHSRASVLQLLNT